MVRLLALGVVCSEKNVNWRQRLRSYYSLRAGADLLVRYVLDEKYVSALQAQGKLVGDEVCFRSLTTHMLHLYPTCCPACSSLSL